MSMGAVGCWDVRATGAAESRAAEAECSPLPTTTTSILDPRPQSPTPTPARFQHHTPQRADHTTYDEGA